MTPLPACAVKAGKKPSARVPARRAHVRPESVEPYNPPVRNAATKTFPEIVKLSTGTAGKPAPACCQFFPASREMYRPFAALETIVPSSARSTSRLRVPPASSGRSCQLQNFPASLENTSPRSDTTQILSPFAETRTARTGNVVSEPTGWSDQVAPRSEDFNNPLSVAANQRVELKAMSLTICPSCPGDAFVFRKRDP